MKIVKIPDIEQYIQPIEELSPSMYTNISCGCPYQYIIGKAVARCGVSIKLPSNVNAIIGTIIHQLFEERVKGSIPTPETFKARWKQLCKEKENDIRTNYPTLINFIVSDYDKMFKAMRIAMNMESEPMSSSNNCYSSIQPAECKVRITGLLKGSIDRVKKNGSEYELIDYKTGQCYDENGNIKQLYIDQLNLYSIMFEHQFDKHVSKLTIIDSDGNNIDIPFIDKSDSDILEEVKQTITRINFSINSQQHNNLAHITVDNCSWCSCRHLCKPFLSSSLNNDANIFMGEIVSIMGNDTIQMRLNNGSTIRIMKMQALRIDDWNELTGRNFIFINLGKKPTENDAYFRQSNTIIFEQ